MRLIAAASSYDFVSQISRKQCPADNIEREVHHVDRDVTAFAGFPRIAQSGLLLPL